VLAGRAALGNDVCHQSTTGMDLPSVRHQMILNKRLAGEQPKH